eukprot:gene40868-biopygen32686
MNAAPPDAEAVFIAQGLTKVYGEGDTAVHALRGVDLSIVRGEFVVLLGASGSGKSTLLNILGGLDSASAGTARWVHAGESHELTGASDAELTRYRREHVGFVFQFYNLIPSLTALENVALVTDLAAALGIERRGVEHHDAALAFLQFLHGRAFEVQRHDLGAFFEVLVA